MDDTVRIPYGEQNGQLIHISKVPNGLKCNCTCPACGTPLVARKGEIRQHYFAHHNPHAVCAHAFETTLHRWVKERIQLRECLMLPGYIVWDDRESVMRTSTPTLVHFDEVQVEKQKGSIRPDLTCFQGQMKVYVEIRVAHKVGPGKAEEVARSGVPTLEIDFGLFGKEFDEERIDRLLFQSAECSKWIFHPEEEKAKRKRAAHEAKVREREEQEKAVAPPEHRNEPIEPLSFPRKIQKPLATSVFPTEAVCRYCETPTANWIVYDFGDNKCICRECLPAHNDRTEARRRARHAESESDSW